MTGKKNWWDKDPGLVKCIQAAYTPARLAALLGIWAQNVSAWEVLPECHLPRIKELFGFEPWEIRPDLFGPDGKRKDQPVKPFKPRGKAKYIRTKIAPHMERILASRRSNKSKKIE